MRSKKCGAPTFSWASVCRKDKLSTGGRPSFSFYGPGPIRPRVQVLDLKGTLGVNPCGNVSDAKVTLSGGLLRGYVYCGKGVDAKYEHLVTITEGLKSCPRKRQSPRMHNHLEDWRIHICAETSGQRAIVSVSIFPDTFDDLTEGFFYLLPVAEAVSSWDWKSGTMPPLYEDGLVFGLILKEISKETFQRVGSVEIARDFLMTTENRSIVLV